MGLIRDMKDSNQKKAAFQVHRGKVRAAPKGTKGRRGLQKKKFKQEKCNSFKDKTSVRPSGKVTVEGPCKKNSNNTGEGKKE